MTDKIKKSLDFVVKFYRPGAFKPDGWFIENPQPWWRRHAVAAAIAGIALVAAAAVATYVAFRPKQEAPAPLPAAPAAPAPEAPQAIPTTPEVRKVEFENASLSQVVAAIEATYGVKVAGLPAEEMRLTLSYQGTAEDLVLTINDLLGTNLVIEP
ncbi:MAG: hypothetical protein HDS66_04430 [Bacteroidales bacterium]|nr:hypothetical protein [Bacteroidales bacterium]